MLNILLSVVLLNVTVLSFFFTLKLNRVEQVFNSFDPTIVEKCVSLDIQTEKYFFIKEEVLSNVKYYFDENLKDFEYTIKFSFREDNYNTLFSSTPNIVQIDLSAKIIFDQSYLRNVRFTLNGREVSKDWWTTF